MNAFAFIKIHSLLEGYVNVYGSMSKYLKHMYMRWELFLMDDSFKK